MKLTFAAATRRTFLRTLLAGWGSAFLAGILYPAGRYLFPRLEREPDEVRLPRAAAEALAPNASSTFAWGSRMGILIKRADGRLRAFKGTCTHLDCNVAWEPRTRRFHCPCHEGWFDADGKNIAGPPPSPLTELVVEEAGEELAVTREGLAKLPPKGKA